MAKGIAVLNASTGAVVHKLVNDGSAQLGTGAGSSVVMSGSVKLENLNVPTSGNRIDAAGSDADNVEKAINGISGSMGQEITDANTRRTNLNNAVEDLQAAAGLTDGTTNSAVATSELNGTPLDFTFSHAGKRYIDDASSFVDADNQMDTELGLQETAVATLEGSGAGSIQKAIADVVGTLQGTDLDTLEEMRTSINSDAAVATTMLNDIRAAIDELDGTVNNAIDSSLRQAQLDLEAERLRRKGSITDDAAVPVSLTTGGTQGAIQHKLDAIQASLGFDANGNYQGAANPAARDITLAAAVQTMETRQNTLETSQFDAVALTVTGVSNIGGHMKFNGAGASFNFPVKTAAEIAAYTNSSSHNGQVFFLNAADDAARTNFEDGMKLYFCENGVWHSSYLLQE